MTALAVTLTIDQLEALVRRAVRTELATKVEATEGPEWLTREQAGEILHCTAHHVSKLARTRGLPGRRMGKEWRFRRVEVLAWLEAQKAGL